MDSGTVATLSLSISALDSLHYLYTGLYSDHFCNHLQLRIPSDSWRMQNRFICMHSPPTYSTLRLFLHPCIGLKNPHPGCLMPPPVLQVSIIFLMYLYQLRDSTANLQRCLQMSIHILKCLHIIYILQLFISHIVLSRYTKTIPKCIMYTGICMQSPLVNILYTVY